MFQKIRYLSAVAIFILSFLALTASAQTDKGEISGKVTDPDGAVLQGAEIVLEPAGVHTVSDEQGQFFIHNIPVGHYTINVTYVGFTALVKEIDVSAGQPTSVDAKMSL